jgi:hypothetical protein
VKWISSGKRQKRRGIDINTPDTKTPKTINPTITPKITNWIRPCKFKIPVV